MVTCIVCHAQRPERSLGMCGVCYRRAPHHQIAKDPQAGLRACGLRVVSLYGPADARRCRCGVPARFWVYGGGAADERTETIRGKLRRFSPNPNDYVAVCSKCRAALRKQLRRRWAVITRFRYALASDPLVALTVAAAAVSRNEGRP